MVLKRLFVMALGALGLGALAVGTAFGQGPQPPGNGNIPAPDLFDDQITCSSQVPALRGQGAVPNPLRVPDDAKTSALDDLIATGSTKTTIDKSDTSAGSYVDLIYVVPPGGQNCGASDDPNDGTNPAFTADDQGLIATHVAQGYSATLKEFMDVYGTGGTKSAVDAARMALNTAIRNDASESRLEDLREELEEAEAADRKARAELDAVGQGPIYQAGIAEWMAKGAVENAVDDWNDAVNAVTNDDSDGTQDVLDASVYMRDDDADQHTRGYIALRADPNGTDEQSVGRVVNANGTVNYSNLRLYVSEAEDGEDAADNFDDNTQRLSLPMSDDPDSDDADDMVPTRVSASIADIRADRKAANDAVEALAKALAENENPQRTDILTEGLRRARLEASHLNEQWADALADNKDLVADVQDDPNTPADESTATPAARASQGEQSIRTRYADNQKALSERDDAEDALREAVAERVAATTTVVRAFTSPSSFYQQLVDRRQSLKDMADNAVTKASEDGATPSKSLTVEAATAAKNLEDAQEAQADYQALYDDASQPVKDLIDELLMTNGDDGQELVDAISGAYSKAQETADMIEGLTGDDGAVSQNADAIAANTTKITENSDNITALDGRVAANEAEIGMDENGMSRIDHNEARSMANATMIGENRGMIVKNAESIVGLRTDVDQNASDIMTNAGNIMDNRSMIGANSDRIGANEMAISGLGNRVGANEGAITGLRNDVGELNEALEVVRAGVAASMALAGMPAINGRGISIGVGSYDGESAFAVGFQIQGEMASFKVGVTSSGGETGASAGVGFQF